MKVHNPNNLPTIPIADLALIFIKLVMNDYDK